MEKSLNSKIFSKLTAKSESTLKNKSYGNYEIEDLPDGSCFSRILKVNSEIEIDYGSSIKKCEYIGSFLVEGNDQNSRTDFVRTQLRRIQSTVQKKRVLLVVSITGIKVCSLDGKSVLMAHALRRISFATCDPESCQFSFLAREPNGHFSLQYCHSFLTSDPETAEALSSVVGSAFRMAFAQQLSHHSPTLQPHSQQTPVSLLGSVSTCREDAALSPRPTYWAKKLASKTKCQDNIASQTIEMNSRPSSISSSESPCASTHQSTMNLSESNPSSQNLPVDLWSPLSGGCSSSEENNSSTDLNSCKQIKEKPPLLKNLEVVQENVLSDDSFINDISRPASGGYINESTSWDSISVLRTPKFNSSSKSERSICKKRENHAPSAPPTDEECLLESSTDQSSKRSSRSSCDQSMPSSSSSDTTNLSDVSSFCKNKRLNHAGNSSSSSLVMPPLPPERHDSLSTTASEERELRGAPWFQAGIPREIALEVLGQEPVGSFMVRESTSKPGCFALSLRVPREFHQSGIAHYLIMRTNRGYKIKGFTKEFGSLTALITHHSVMPELLPCPLSLSRYNPTFKKNDFEDLVDMNEDPDYSLLSDFRNMLANINA
ncbi:EGFR adapter protein-like [Uloborus diversus]|uniref:EGFR adapter protein-like n=1 Tax=Uloborus diversus TaxID=327109 RepID=UPI00240A7167|nr:EGFR adapter protein-like [Uloborus diversus]